ncbi:Lysosomal acid phosphatase [Fasciola gigantica]|uniref:Lysosomal acid phosphatase n=1 Tax=Fasciola gigantica TaxID=46835 RepID=A0A504YZ42_FASGI|nr:Lysosomal acid phosphatase [Fasciola gigantica]
MQQKYTSTSLIVRLEIGVFLSLLRDHLLAIVSGSRLILNRRHHLAVQHLMAYSAHDTDVCYLLAAFGAYYEHIIPYSAAIVIELLGPKPPAPASEYRLRLVYKRGYLDSEGHYVQFGACTNEPAERGCPLEDVLAFVSPLFLESDNFDAECQVKFVSTEEILRREIGVFLHSFVTHINAVVQDSMNMTRPLGSANLSTWHTMAYSAHDKDVAYVLAALGVYDERMVDNSAAIVLELLGPDKKQADSLSDFIIRIRYKRGWSDLKGEYLQFPSCHDRPATAGCPWNKLLEQIQPLLVSPEQYAELCSNMSYTNGPMHDSRLRTFILVSSGLCATAVMVLLTVFLMRRFRRQKHLLQDDEQVVFVRFDQHSL